MHDLTYKIGIGLISGIGDVMAKKLIAYCGSVEAVFHEKKQALLKIPGVGETLAQAVATQNVIKQAEAEIEFINRHQISCSFYLDDGYPSRLKECPDAPVIFFYRGCVNFENPKIISVVGTRGATGYGKDLCNQFIEELYRRNHNPVIVSGLAYGIDICAHRAALRNGLHTIAVLGHGLSQIYPAAHTATAREIVQQGALLTEFLSHSLIDRKNFIRRNRIIAGLADATIIVESDVKGGALITADIANSYNRDVFAFPGRLTDPCSSGCNRLIKTNKACLLQSVDDIEYIMNWNACFSKPVQQKLFIPEDPEEKQILLYLKERDKCIIDELCVQLQMPVGKVSALLLNLELSGLISSLPGKMYQMNMNT